MNTPTSTNKILSTNLFPVVGIGASAGGLDAFKRFLSAIPEKSGFAYVIVQHLDPNHKSILPSLLQKATKIPVLEITDDIKVEPDHIYIIPSNRTMVANDGVLELRMRPKKSPGIYHLPIDIFFASLAEVHQSHAIGIVLSGNGADGTLGLKAIKKKGGITLVQDSLSASSDEMPLSAVAAGVADFILPPEEMPAKLVELMRIEGAEDKEGLLTSNDDYKQILSLLHKRKGNDFTHYKESTIRRRIARRMVMHNDVSSEDYLSFLKNEKSEQDALYQDVLIPVTSFFRDTKIFDNLCHSVFPHLLKNKPAGKPVRIWIAGCSSGQEAYSMAICLKEFLGDNEEKVQVFATDISQSAIDKARKGLYSEKEVEGVDPKRLQKYFSKQKDGYLVVKDIRDMCVFAIHNFLKDAPFGKLDLVSCRNVLIYMSPYLQKRALTTFHYALNPKAMLLLGKSETVNSVPELFAITDKSDKLFTRKYSPAHYQQYESGEKDRFEDKVITSHSAAVVESEFGKAADAIVLSNYTPAGVVVNQSLDVVQYRGSTGLYFEASPGKPSHNILKLARKDLSFELRSLLRKARKGKVVLKDNILLKVAGVSHIISIEVIPLPNMSENYFLILFHQEEILPGKKTKRTKPKQAARLEKDSKEQHILELEKELDAFRADMRSITAEQEEANEQLQSANEELLSANEELQSLNEELETSKEEYQSTNEELSSLNEQYNASRLYAESIVETIREPVIVLDKELRIRTANNAFCKAFYINKKDTEGVLIYELANKEWDIPGLRTLLEEIMPQQKSFTGFEVRQNFAGLGERVMLLNALEMKQGKDKEKLILLAIDDITEQEQRLAKKKELLTRFQNLVMQAPVAICILSGHNHLLELANDSYFELIGKDKSAIDQPLVKTLPELESQGIINILDSVWETGVPYHGFEQELLLQRKGIQQRCYFNFVYQPLREVNQQVTGIIVVVAEVTEQVMARKRMEAQAAMVNNLMMTAPGFVCTLIGPKHIYGLVNERYQALFGKRVIRGKPIMDALPELAGQGFDVLLDKVYNTGEPYLGIDVPISLARDEDATPEIRYFNFSYQPMYDDDHAIFAILVFGYEVTNQVLAKNKIVTLQQKHASVLEEKVQERTLQLSVANQELLHKNEELIRMNEELESFNYISSHDLQEPLRKITTYISLLEEKETTALSVKGKAYCKTIRESAVRMRSLISDLMTYSVTDMKDRKFALTDLNELVNEVRTDLEPLLLEKNGTIEIKPLCTVCINASQFSQVFINLVSNAIKFSRPGISPRIVIDSKQLQWDELSSEVPPVILGALSHKEDYCRIRVTDNGIGFPPEYSHQVFQIFQRLHKNENYPGTGIGLAIVKKIVEHHDGFITADSKPGEGATFSIYLPAPKTDADCCDTSPETHEPVHSHSSL